MQPATIQKLAKQEFTFATFPEVRIYDKPIGKKKSIQHLLNGKGHQKWSNELTKEVDGETWVQVVQLHTKKSAELFIKLMDDDFLKSDLTQQLYDSITKDALMPEL